MISHYDGFGTMCGALLRTKILFIYTFINEIVDLMEFIWRRGGGKKRRRGPRKRKKNRKRALKLDIKINYYIIGITRC